MCDTTLGPDAQIDESDLAGHDLSTRYIAAVYSSLCMLVGENMDPRSPTERSFAVLVILYGACMNATLFGQVALLLSNQNSSHNHFQQSLDTVNQNMRILKLPEGLQQRGRWPASPVAWHSLSTPPLIPLSDPPHLVLMRAALVVCWSSPPLL